MSFILSMAQWFGGSGHWTRDQEVMASTLGHYAPMRAPGAVFC